MNTITLTGYLAADPELRQTNAGIPVARCSIAVKRPHTKNDKTDFIRIVCWRNAAEFITRYFSKGSGIEVTGYLTIQKWEDNNGVKHNAAEVVVENIDFGKKNDRNGNGGDYQQSPMQQSTAQRTEPPAQLPIGDLDDYEEILSDGQVPF